MFGFDPKSIAEARAMFQELVGSMKALKTEMEQRRILGTSLVPWDQHVLLRAAAGVDAQFDLVRSYGKVATQSRVIVAPAGSLVAYNGGEAYAATTNNLLDDGLIQTVRLDNRAGASEMQVVVYLVAGAALRAGARA